MTTSAFAVGGPRRVTIDLDGQWCYRRIHGDAGEHAPAYDPVLIDGTSRFLDACARFDVIATLFVVGADLEQSSAFRDLIAAAARAGHEVMSHSFAHDYALAHASYDEIRSDLTKAQDAIEGVTGTRPRGFRAPGYTTSMTMWRALSDTGHTWSSSVLPSPPYLAVKQLVRLRAALLHTTSQSQSGSLRAYSPFFARPPATLSLVEHPISTACGLPWLGTTVAMLPDALGDALTTLALSSQRHVVFELHAADFADGDLLPEGQPDRAVPLRDKLRRVERALRRADGA